MQEAVVVVFIRSAVTVGMFLLFISVCVWAFSGRRRRDFAEAARLPFDDEVAGGPGSEERR